MKFLALVSVKRYRCGRRETRDQNGVPGSYMDVFFELMVHEELEVWASLLHSFTKGGLVKLPG